MFHRRKVVSIKERQYFLGMLGILFINTVKAPSNLYIDFYPNDCSYKD